jgi:hypothetical protein
MRICRIEWIFVDANHRRPKIAEVIEDHVGALPEGEWLPNDTLNVGDWASGPESLALPVPSEITRRQLWLWLYQNAGVTRDQVRGLVGSSTTLTADDIETALIEIDEAEAYHRVHPLIAQIGGMLGLDSEEALDQAFREAAAL